MEGCKEGWSHASGPLTQSEASSPVEEQEAVVVRERVDGGQDVLLGEPAAAVLSSYGLPGPLLGLNVPLYLVTRAVAYALKQARTHTDSHESGTLFPLALTSPCTLSQRQLPVH
eukprot:1160624-Pelagomonas_calceolata.AAC.7